MTDIQVKYQTLQEAKRHNEEMEHLGAVSNAIANEQAAAQWKKVNSDVWNNAFKTIFGGVESVAKAASGITKTVGDIAKVSEVISLFA